MSKPARPTRHFNLIDSSVKKASSNWKRTAESSTAPLWGGQASWRRACRTWKTSSGRLPMAWSSKIAISRTSPLHLRKVLMTRRWPGMTLRWCNSRPKFSRNRQKSSSLQLNLPTGQGMLIWVVTSKVISKISAIGCQEILVIKILLMMIVIDWLDYQLIEPQSINQNQL